MNNSMITTTNSRALGAKSSQKTFTQLHEFISTCIATYLYSTPCSDKVYIEIRSATHAALDALSHGLFRFLHLLSLYLSLCLPFSLSQPASRVAASVKCQHNKQQQQLVRCNNNNNNMKRKPVDKVNVQWNDTYHGEVHRMLLLLSLSLSLINDSARSQRIKMKEEVGENQFPFPFQFRYYFKFNIIK